MNFANSRIQFGKLTTQFVFLKKKHCAWMRLRGCRRDTGVAASGASSGARALAGARGNLVAVVVRAWSSSESLRNIVLATSSPGRQGVRCLRWRKHLAWRRKLKLAMEI